ncbi:hypothetical protein [Chryseobacterium sp. CH25]|uniref:hypothetical protein n=1 Tax=Chryseobacterium sp. CH25 TaxID=713559 RepID=UPI001E456241|nr:hypothetical protein [Chryseobacterium sp. CH25]
MIHEQKTGATPGEVPAAGNAQRIKKWGIYLLMAIAFAGCLYLIFAPKKMARLSTIRTSLYMAGVAA